MAYQVLVGRNPDGTPIFGAADAAQEAAATKMYGGPAGFRPGERGGQAGQAAYTGPTAATPGGAAAAAIGAPAAPVLPASQTFSSATGGRDVSFTGGAATALQGPAAGGAGGNIAGTTADIMNRAASQRLAALRR